MTNENPRSLALGVLMSGVSGTQVPSWLADALVDGLAGVILFSENVPDLPTARRFCDDIRALSNRVVISCDEEGGEVTRLQASTGSDVPSAATLGVVDDATLTHKIAAAYGRLICLAGIDLPLAPDLDVASEPNNPVIGVRSFGATPELVARHGAAFVTGLHEGGVACCTKHFPGHGDTTVDSHLGLPVIDVDEATLINRDMAPFAHVQADSATAAEAVMTAHVIVPAKGPQVASLSAWATHDIRALGMSGPIITDALGMKAVNAQLGIGEAAVVALAAGADWLCLDAPFGHDPELALGECVNAITQALINGRLRADALRASAKRNAALRREHPGADEQGFAEAITQLAELGLQAASRAISSTGDTGLHATAVVADIRQHITPASGRTSAALLRALSQRDPRARGVDAPSVLASALADNEQLVLITAHPLGDRDEAKLLAELVAKYPDAIVVHTGLASAAPQVANLICAHGSGRANSRAAAAVLCAAFDQTAGQGGQQ